PSDSGSSPVSPAQPLKPARPGPSSPAPHAKMTKLENISSSSPAGESPVRVAARRLGSRLAARSGNGSGRSPASKAPLGGARCVTRVNPAASLDIEGEPSRAVHGEGHGSGEDPGSAAARDSSAEEGAERSDGDGGNWGGPPRPKRCELRG